MDDRYLFVACLALSIIIFFLFGKLLMPVIVAIIIGYLLDPFVSFLHKKIKMPRLLCVYIVFVVFILLVFVTLIFIIPNIIYQTGQLLSNTPAMLEQIKILLLNISKQYPEVLPANKINGLYNSFSGYIVSNIANISTGVVSISLSSLSFVFICIMYLFIIPFLVFYMLKDKYLLINAFMRIIPKDQKMLFAVWYDLKPEIANYVKGKVWEMIIVICVSYPVLLIFDLNYALLLSVIIGASVLIPYVGAILATFATCTGWLYAIWVK